MKIKDMPEVVRELVTSGEWSKKDADLVLSYTRCFDKLMSGTKPSRVLTVAKANRRDAERTALGKPRPHYSRYHPKIIEAIQERIGDSKRILDPMAGTMERLRVLEDPLRGYHQVYGVEIEPEWVEGYPHPRLHRADSTDMRNLFEDEFFDAIVVSPVYGNRDSDLTGEWWDNSDRKSYAAGLGRNPSKGSAARGLSSESDEYRLIHAKIWCESVRVLMEGGLFFLNVKNYIRNHTIIRVSQWHRDFLRDHLGMQEIDDTAIPTEGRKHGTNTDVRAEKAEKIYVYVKPVGIQQRVKAIHKDLRKGKWSV